LDWLKRSSLVIELKVFGDDLWMMGDDPLMDTEVTGIHSCATIDMTGKDDLVIISASEAKVDCWKAIVKFQWHRPGFFCRTCEDASIHDRKMWLLRRFIVSEGDGVG